MTCLKEIDLDFTDLHFFNDYVISTVKKDMVLEKDQIDNLKRVCQKFFDGKKFVYIANRKNDYNVNPTIYINLSEGISLSGIAVVSENISRLQTANFEKQFSNIPFELFQNLEEAKAWARSLTST